MDTPTVIVRSTTTPQPSVTKPAKTKKKTFKLVPKLLITLAIAIVAMFTLPAVGGVASATGAPSSAAQAWTPWDAGTEAISNAVCSMIGGRIGDDTLPSYEHSWPGAAGFMGNAARDANAYNPGDIIDKYGKSFAEQDVHIANAYMMFGTGGLKWDAHPYEMYLDGAGCSMMNSIGTHIANMGFVVVTLVGEITLSFFGWAMSLNAFEPLVNSVGDSVKTLGDDLRLNYLTPILLFSALWMAWQGLVKKRTSEAIQGAIWAVCAGVAGSLFLINPTAVAHSINNGTQAVTNYTITSLSGIGSDRAGDGGNMCETSLRKSEDEGWMRMQCSVWRTFIYTPWMVGQFGPNGLQHNVSEGQTLTGGTNQIKSLGFNYLSVTTKSHDMALGKLNMHNDEKRKEIWNQVLAQVCEGSALGNPCDSEKRDSSTLISAFTGENWIEKVQVSFLAFIGMGSSMVPLLFLLMTLVMYQIMLFFLFLAAPFMLLIGIHPGFGRKASLGWLGMIASLTMKRIGTAIIIGGLLAFYNIVIGSGQGMNFLMQLFFLGIASIAAFVIRGKLLKAMGNVDLKSLGGTAAGGQGKQMGGNLSRQLSGGAARAAAPAARAAGIPVQQAGLSGGAAAAAGAVGGAILTKAAGGYMNKRKAQKDEQNMSPSQRVEREIGETKREDKVMEEIVKRLGSKDPQERESARALAKEFVAELANKGRAIPVPSSGPARVEIETIARDAQAKVRPIEERKGPRRPNNKNDRPPEPKDDPKPDPE